MLLVDKWESVEDMSEDSVWAIFRLVMGMLLGMCFGLLGFVAYGGL